MQHCNQPSEKKHRYRHKPAPRSGRPAQHRNPTPKKKQGRRHKPQRTGRHTDPSASKNLHQICKASTRASRPIKQQDDRGVSKSPQRGERSTPEQHPNPRKDSYQRTTKDLQRLPPTPKPKKVQKRRSNTSLWWCMQVHTSNAR